MFKIIFEYEKWVFRIFHVVVFNFCVVFPPSLFCFTFLNPTSISIHFAIPPPTYIGIAITTINKSAKTIEITITHLSFIHKTIFTNSPNYAIRLVLVITLSYETHFALVRDIDLHKFCANGTMTHFQISVLH